MTQTYEFGWSRILAELHHVASRIPDLVRRAKQQDGIDPRPYALGISFPQPGAVGTAFRALARSAFTMEADASRGRSKERIELENIGRRHCDGIVSRPIDFRVPVSVEAYHAIHGIFADPRLWPGEWPYSHRQMLAQLDHQDISMNLWSRFREWSKRHGGIHSGRVDIVLSDTAAVAPDQFYFAKDKDECMIEEDYFQGIPDLIAEVLAPASLAIDRGPRLELYRKHHVPHHWLLDPITRTIEVRQLIGHDYHLQSVLGTRDVLRPAIFPNESVDVATMFETQSSRWDDPVDNDAPEPLPEWLIPAEIKLGLEYFFLLGHPERRWEIWNNRCPNVLAFGSATEAQARLTRFIPEACAWEGLPNASAQRIAHDTDVAEVGRFQFRRTGRHIHLDVLVDASKYRQLLEVHAKREAWDWGEK